MAPTNKYFTESLGKNNNVRALWGLISILNQEK